jgi:hypothetical protein
VTDSDPGFDAFCELYGPGGNLVRFSSNSIMRVLQPGRRYTILVHDDQADDRGLYRLRIACKPRLYPH